MAGEWYNQAEAKAILDGITTKDVSISAEDDRLVFSLRDDLDARLEVIRLRTVSKQVGYTLSEAEKKEDYDEIERWFEEEESQISVSDRLLQLKKREWGDPNELLGYGPETANSMWRKNPNVIKEVVKRREDLLSVQDSLH